MFIYADESGHSGRYIFNEPIFYFQGAILSVIDPEALLNPIVEKYRAELGVHRLHANELKHDIVERIAASFLSHLEDVYWIFHLTVIEKPYLAVTKFVDSMFDSYENKGARWLWYNHEFFRHTLCCLFDDILSEQKKKDFWEAYLKDDHKGISSIVKEALDILDNFVLDKRLKQVAKDGLLFALKYPKEITLMASRTKKSYKGHTPNMVAFISLLHAVHEFCKDHNVVPKAFIHDTQSEFGSTMREYHKHLSKVRVSEHEVGFPPRPEEVEYDLGKFALTPSKYLAGLQAVDIFLWLSQRSDRIKNEVLKKSLRKRIDPFYISRASSEMIIAGWLYKLSNTELTKEQVKAGKEIIEKMENIHLKKLNEFESQKLIENN